MAKTIDPAMRSMPRTASIDPEDEEILRQRELEELRLLFEACQAWRRERDLSTATIAPFDADLLRAISRACRYK